MCESGAKRVAHTYDHLMKTVAVLGGGVAGLSAAHELVERGFAVTVYEGRDSFGEKRALFRFRALLLGIETICRVSMVSVSFRASIAISLTQWRESPQSLALLPIIWWPQHTYLWPRTMGATR